MTKSEILKPEEISVLDRKTVKVSVDDIVTFDKGFTIYWQGNIGFGEYTVYKDENGIWNADSECMDSKDDRWFLKLLMEDFIEKQIGVVR